MSLSLNASQIQDLVKHYGEEKAKLEFKLQNVSVLIAQLNASLEDTAQTEVDALLAEKLLPKYSFAQEAKATEAITEVENEEALESRAKTETKAAESIAAKSNETKSKSVRQTTKRSKTPKRPGRPKGSGGRLSEWDSIIISGLRKTGKTMTNPDMLALFKEKNEKESLGEDETTLRSRLNRCLQKLANRKKRLVKIPYSGKGFAYGLNGWIDKETGELKPQYLNV